ncbi:LysR family transcriptional regulator [Paracoccus mangrovi]|uniref:LysR family transcriptional regulator n=1 Tax=Paracoccus mangrovi TaxID=1715645 RepID=A0ABV7QZG5_9RHOB
MRLNLWTEIRTAAHVARLGRVSAAAEALSMHHSSVIRHIDQLELHLRTKLFQRHARGYTPTEAGEELLRTASLVDEQIAQMLTRIETSSHQVSGQLIVTGVPSIERCILPIIARFQQEHPKLQVIYRSDERTYEMASGEAHIALRAGPRPSHPDYIVSPLVSHRVALYCTQAYIDAHGRPDSPDHLKGHRYIHGEGDYSRAPFNQWLSERLSEDCFALRTPQPSVVYWSVMCGLGIGFLARGSAERDLIELFPDYAPPEWEVPLWVVTHVDLHRSSKVGSFARFIQGEALKWEQSWRKTDP